MSENSVEERLVGLPCDGDKGVGSWHSEAPVSSEDRADIGKT